MSNMKLTAAPASEGSSFFANLRHKMPKDTGIFVVMLVIALTFEIAGWYVRDQSFLLNTNRLVLIVLQVAIIGIIAVGVTQVIITTGIDLPPARLLPLRRWWRPAWRKPPIACRQCSRRWSTCRR